MLAAHDRNEVEQRLAPALETLDGLLSDGNAGTFDMAFIDADKSNYANYYERALELLRPGGVAVIDNVLWHGAVIDPNDREKETEILRVFNEKLHADDRIALTLVPLGDGLTLACKL